MLFLLLWAVKYYFVCSFKKEFKDIYNLDVVAIPTVLPIKRVDQTVGVFVTRRDKNDSILNLISEKYQYQQPIVLIVESIKESVEFSTMLNKLGIKHTLLNALNSEKSPEVFANAGTYGSVVIATQLANRGIDIKLGGDAERMTIFNLVESGIDVSGIDQIAYRLPSDEIKSSELYRKYSALLEKNKAIVSFNKNKVIEAGGLCVISTTMYFDMRTEQQIRGRAGRQGEVGESYVFISMEDDLMVKALGKLLKSRLLQNMVKGVPIIDSHIMKRSIEFFKNQVHHDTFAKMRNATDLSIRKDKSKNEIFKLKYGISDETVTFDDLIKIWCKNDVNIKSAQEIANGNIRNATPSMLFLWKRYTELFADLNSQNISEKLFEIAGLHVSETPLSKSYKILLFIFELSNALSLHLTEMDDAETMYGSMNIKNSNTYFDDLYSKNLTNHISDAIDRWLIKLEKRRYKKSAE